MENGIGKELEDDEYLELYKQIYDAENQKGDFSHMLYTISANLKDKGDKVDNKWGNILAPETGWDSEEERKDVAGWLGDAVYDGDGKVSFGMDDYIADLDADNIAYMVTDEKSLVDVVNEYYSKLQEAGDEYRTEMFVKNNTYEEIESTIFDKISVKDSNGDGEINYKDLQENDKYQDTYDFLKKLEPYSEVQEK